MPSHPEHVRRLVGDISPRQYRHVDVALAQYLGCSRRFRDSASTPPRPGTRIPRIPSSSPWRDPALEARLVQERAWLKDMVAAQAAGKLYLFRIVHGEIHDWTMATNLHEKEQVPLRF